MDVERQIRGARLEDRIQRDDQFGRTFQRDCDQHSATDSVRLKLTGKPLGVRLQFTIVELAWPFCQRNARGLFPGPFRKQDMDRSKYARAHS